MNITHFLRRALFVLMIAALAAVGASAQLSTASLSGSVTDPTGAVVPHAKITLTQTETNFTRVDTSKDDGTYHEEFLPLGPYKVTVAAPGFKTSERSGIVLSVMQNATLNLTMEMGGASETVSVTADVPLVNLSNSVLGATVSNEQIDNLPLINRDVYQLLSLTPGVQSNASSNSLGFTEYHVYINGSTDDFTGQVSYYLDGGLNMTGLRNSGNASPNPEATSQYDVQTNNFSAQLGRYAAAVVSMVTKSGTNQWHGSAFEFYRGRNFNAVTHNQQTKAPYNQHRFGATFGGPIRHDKDFFFGSYGGYRYRTSSAYVSSVPSVAQMQGNFFENLSTDQLDPVTKQPSCKVAPTAADNVAFKFLVCDPVSHKPLANNTLPSTLLDPTAQNVLKFLANGNMTGPLANTGALTQNPTAYGDTQYTHREYDPAPQNNDEYLIKTDHQVTPEHRVTLSYFLYKSDTTINPGGLTSKWTHSLYSATQQDGNMSDTWTISPRTVNQAWLSYTRQYGGRIPVPDNSTWADFGSDFGISGAPSRGQISTLSGWFGLTQAITGPKAGANLYGFRDVLNTTRGKHNLYLGGEFGLEKDFMMTSLNNYGVFAFATTAGSRTNYNLSDFIAGMPNTMEQDTGEYANANYFNYSVFAQDDWKLLPNLTINLGVRYDWQQAPTDTQSRQTNFIPGLQSHAFSTVNISGKTGNQLAPIGMLFPGDPGVPRGGAFTPNNHVSPRVGFSWDPFGNGKTVIHGAGGIFFGGISGNLWELPSNFAPYAVRPVFSKVTSMTHPYSNDATEFPGGVNPFPTLTFTPGTSTASFLALNQVSSMDPHFKWPFTYQLNFGLQQQVTSTLAFSANYVGSLNHRLPVYMDLNPAQFNVTAAGTSGASCADLTKACGYANTSSTVNNRRVLNSQYGLSAASPVYSNVYNIQSNQGSNYNALQVTVEKRLTHRVSAKGSYTWSHTLASTYLDGTSLNTTFVDYNYAWLEKHQRSDQDRRHMASASVVWKPDYFSAYNRTVRTALNGWTVTAILTANSGQPFTVTTGVDNYFNGQGNNRPSIVPGMTQRTFKSSSRSAEMAKWFDTSAYCIAGTTTGTTTCPGVGPLNLLGLERPNTLSVPGYRMVDMSVVRNIQLYDRLKFELRGEAKNAFNLTNLGTPVSAMNNVNFGKITTGSGSNDNRILQIGGRLLF
ncbi:MAG: carboxypeptidase regulatory-like domain-containing protein [Terracidiphilus sp.]|nr:carboxypeptidase regulatory-like domain-containing protein [Terracidiphilus sp.]MDR3775676.1 carboxypeptidase regulatory-like domain-containing protein [Terracidiphilus sp.]